MNKTFLDGYQNKWEILSVEETLRGDLISIKGVDGDCSILALFEKDNWFCKVTLLQAYALNYQYAENCIKLAHNAHLIKLNKPLQ